MTWLAGASLLLAVQGVTAQSPATPLFSSDAPIRISIRGPINAIARDAEDSVAPRDAMLVLATPAESHPIRISPRGISRRKKDTCRFPPLRVEFVQAPMATSLFARQRRLKLVTHCRHSEGFQQHLLLEYSAYRMFNQLTPLSYRVRLAAIDYVEPNGKVTARWGFFIEDLDDAARRNGLKEARVTDRILVSQLEPRQAASVSLFQYMIGNLDWSMRAGPRGEGCCHNSRLLAGPGSSLIPLAYDFDYSGLVDAPYALPPDAIKVRSVRERRYMGYCLHNQAALSAAADMRAKRATIEGVFGQIPGMSDRTRGKALVYLSSFFKDIESDEMVRTKLLKSCWG